MPSFDSVLVANRGEIACRIFRTVHRLGMSTVAVYSDADASSRHVAEADVAVRIGPAAARDSYLNVPAIIDAAVSAGAQAIHPGYGFLAENAVFARAVVAAGLVWIGPSADAIDAMGDKISAKQLVSAAGVAVVPGRAVPGMTDDDIASASREIGVPVLIKPSAGGGGKGMHVVTDLSQLPDAISRARREAAASFGDDTLFVERYVSRPRHIEVQVLADSHGNIVHLGERECSLQRRHQKVIEEAPSPLLDPTMRAAIGAAACDTARSVDYLGVGTVEFIVSDESPGEFFFMEMNTRLQVEHPVTEFVTGLDLVEQQLLTASGLPLSFSQDDVVMTGHSIEARVYAEDPDRGFLPTTGTMHVVSEPSGDGVRVDSAIVEGADLVTDYDPMLAKVIAYGSSRDEAVRRLDEALAATVLLGATTNISFLRGLLSDPFVRAGQLDTGLIERFGWVGGEPPDDAYIAVVMDLIEADNSYDDDPWSRGDGWRLGGVAAPRRFRFRQAEQIVDVAATLVSAGSFSVSVGAAEPVIVQVADVRWTRLELVIDGRRVHVRVAHDGDASWVHLDGRAWALTQAGPLRIRESSVGVSSGELRSPMPGTVIAVNVASGDTVTAGQAVAVVEAMKMEHTISAAVDGTVEELTVRAGDSVALDQLIARIT